MKRLAKLSVLMVVLVGTLGAASANPLMGPMLSKAWLTEARVQPQLVYALIEWYQPDYCVETSADFRLEDGTYVGSSGSGGCGNMGGLEQGVYAAGAGAVGEMLGSAAGSAAGAWVAGQVSIGATTGAYATGMFALAAGPYLGAAAGAILAFA